ncbi:DUF2061 domain-containing protein [Haloarcula salinisoli]|uniref:DUF2061 domain-containing protein n=1 Tax=Haloarcula salinisoli TaxID=2487746 RepID=A0A8J7YE29_9EURY|nr:DUF2061 domain-containing protein [Halomicroarcula salinisoli]MBX0284770.1 DUF2061 domain-containing protein [Halomicroarcula salinisoli]MBX0303772.1 DUF2061 domain-containing protein [Halomicroarcula salinisoli]
MVQHRRSLVKAVSYRLFATSVVFAIAFIFTGELGSSAKIGLSAAVAKTLLYYLWERLWTAIDWGTEPA